jgi:hypothetical protein
LSGLGIEHVFGFVELRGLLGTRLKRGLISARRSQQQKGDGKLSHSPEVPLLGEDKKRAAPKDGPFPIAWKNG